MEPERVPVRPVITWLIHVYDKAALERFPFKWYFFNYARATESEIADVLRLVWDRDSFEDSDAWPKTINKGRLQVLLGGDTSTSHEILKYRHLFEELGDESKMDSSAMAAVGFATVSLPFNSYFEDETGKPISWLQIQDTEANIGRKADEAPILTVVLDCPESVLRFGPANRPIRPEKWKNTDADLFRQPETTFHTITSSRWYQTPCSVEVSKEASARNQLPLHEDCLSVVLPFRQIYSSGANDNLFNRCCTIHNRHCPDSAPWYFWVSTYKRHFNTYVEGAGKMLGIRSTLTVRRYLDAVVYGAGLIHAQAQEEQCRNDLELLLKENSKELVVFSYHYVLHQVLGYVAMALPIMIQNAHYWVSELGWAGPERTTSLDLLG